MKWRWLTAGVMLATFRGQESGVTTLSLKTKVVAVPAVVRDRSGRAVAGLGKDDFVLKQDGKEQAIRYFSEDADLPLTLCLMVDTSGSQRTFIRDETKASEVFFRTMLKRPVDRAMLVQFDSNVYALQGMTGDVGRLEGALKLLDRPHDSALPGGRPGTLLYDAIWATAKASLGKETGRRAMVLLTDGEDNGSRVLLPMAIAEALRADIVVYSIHYSARNGFDRFQQPGRDVLVRLSQATGGRVFDVGEGQTLEQIYGQIAEDMRLQYQIGYPAPDGAAGQFHRIELKARDRKLKVEARTGYYSPE